MENIFLSILLTSAIGAVFAMLLTALKPITRKVFSASWHYYMWLCVLLVMILPIRIHLPEKSSKITTEAPQYTVTQAQLQDNVNPNISVSYSISDTDTAPSIEASAYTWNRLSIISLIWLIGVIAVFLTKTAGYLVFLARLHRLSVPYSCPELSKYTDKAVKVRISDKLTSPLVVGLFKHTLILPETALSQNQLECILLHETTHIHRHDILYKWLVFLVKCIHWFNPAIYFIGKQINDDCEISCDLAVLKNMDKSQEIEYAETILTLLSGKKKTVPLSTGMTGSKKTLKKRFNMIKNRFNPSKKQVITSVIVAIILLILAVLASGIFGGYLPGRTDADVVNTDKSTGDDFNLLFIGLDKGKRADTIILFEVYESCITGTFIPRDTLIGEKRISQIYSRENGTQALVDAVRNELSVPINYYAEVSLDAVSEVIDLLGGINFNVPMDMVYSDPYQDLNINLKQGYFTINGEGVTGLLQFRPGKGTHGDLSRIYIQQDFIKSFLKQKTDAANMDRLPEIYKAVSENIKTNIPLKRLINNANILTAVQNNSIILKTLDGEITEYNGIPVYLPSDEIPIVWPTESTKISRGFEKREHPITGEIKEHNGVDILAEENSPVVSAIYGTVTETGYDREMGNYVIIENDYPARVMYGHLADVFVSQGNSVSQQDLIGTVGKTGMATGAHLHFEMQLNGEYYDLSQVLEKENRYHNGIDRTDPSAVVNAFFRAFESGNYPKMMDYCSSYVKEKHFLKNDNGNVFAVFGMSMAKLRSISEVTYLKNNTFFSYNVNVSCKTPQSFSILQSKKTFNVFLEKLPDGTYIICDLSYFKDLPPVIQQKD